MLSFESIKHLFCIKILNTLIQIWPKTTIAVGKLKKKIRKFCPTFLTLLKFRTLEGTVVQTVYDTVTGMIYRYIDY